MCVPQERQYFISDACETKSLRRLCFTKSLERLCFSRNKVSSQKLYFTLFWNIFSRGGGISSPRKIYLKRGWNKVFWGGGDFFSRETKSPPNKRLSAWSGEKQSLSPGPWRLCFQRFLNVIFGGRKHFLPRKLYFRSVWNKVSTRRLCFTRNKVSPPLLTFCLNAQCSRSNVYNTLCVQMCNNIELSWIHGIFIKRTIRYFVLLRNNQ